MLLLLLGLSWLYATQTMQMQFESDDIRFLWWAFENLSTPWEAFTDPALFGTYFRPVISLVWWTNYSLFGANAFWHQLFVCVLWSGIAAMLFLLVKARNGAAAGFAAGLALLCMYAGVNPIVWKSWLTTICSVLFQLAALLALNGCMERIRIWKLFAFAALCALAMLSKESAIAVLPLTASALIAVSSRASLRLRFGLALIVWACAIICAWSAPNLFAFATFAQSRFSSMQDWMNLAGFFSGSIWTSYWLAAVGIVFVIYELIDSDKAARIACGAAGAFSAAVGILFYQNGLPPREALSLSLMLFVQVCWFSRNRKAMAVPLIWLLVAFWPLPALGLRSVPYATDASVALAWLLGVLAKRPMLEALAWVNTKRHVKRRIAARLVLAVCVMLFVFAFAANMQQFNGWMHYAYTVYHSPEQRIRETALYDLAAHAIDGAIYIDVGDRLGLETYLAVAGHDRFDLAISQLPLPPGAVRFEALTEKMYSNDPSDSPLDVWIDTPFPMPQRVLDDPYFSPERWESTLISSCESLDGWQGAANPRIVGFPIGQGGHIQFDLNAETSEFLYSGELASPPDHDGWLLQFWMESRRWDVIDRIEIRLDTGEQAFVWSVSPASQWQGVSDWRRIRLRASDAQIIDQAMTNETPSLQWRIHCIGERPIAVGIDEVKLYTPLAPDQAPGS